MNSVSNLAILLGFVFMLLGGIGYAIFLGMFRSQLNQSDPTLYSQLGFDTGATLLTSQGTREAQKFLFQRRYKQHADAQVRQLGSRLYASMSIVAFGLFLLVGGVLFQ